MRLDPPQTLAGLAELLGLAYVGPAGHPVTGLNEIHRVQPGDLTFADVRKYFQRAIDSPATTLLLSEHVDLPPGKGLLISDDPFRDFNRLTRHFRPARLLDHHARPHCAPGVRLGQNTHFGEDVLLEEGVEIGHNCVIGSHVRIGAGTLIHPNVTVHDYTRLGAGCIIHAGAVLGSDAFYFKRREWGRERMHTCGDLHLGESVEVGAGTTLDRGVTGTTRIGDHSKIDNLCQVAHDTVLGKHCLLAAQVGIAGACELADNVSIWGQVGIGSDVHIGAGATVLAKSAIPTGSRLTGDETYFGIPVQPARTAWRDHANLRRLRELMPRLLRLGEGGGPPSRKSQDKSQE